MPRAALPVDEAARLSVLQSYDVLDTDCESAFDNIASLAARLTDSPISLVSLLDGDRQWFKARHGLDVRETHRDLAFCGYAILDPGKPLVVPDARKDSRFADNPLVTGEPGIRFYAGIPLVTPEGAAIGTLCVIDRQPREMSADQCETLRRLAEAVMTTLELHRTMRRLRNVSLLDPLTGVTNRIGIVDAIDEAIGRLKTARSPFALLQLGLDGFKRVNQLQGHAAGDWVIRDVAGVLKAAVPHGDTLGRLGGDEFAMILTGSEAEAIAMAERTRAAVQSCMEKRGLLVTASLGLAFFQVAPDTADRALVLGEALMHRAKASGRNQIRYGDPSLPSVEYVAPGTDPNDRSPGS